MSETPPAGPVHPAVVDPERVGTYPASAFAGGGYVWDAVLEYRVWCQPDEDESEHEASDYYYAFASYEEALECSRNDPRADEPLALILQREYIDEPEPGDYRHVREERITEWPVEFLRRRRRTEETLARFFAPDAPENRVDVIRGLAEWPP